MISTVPGSAKLIQQAEAGAALASGQGRERPAVEGQFPRLAGSAGGKGRQRLPMLFDKCGYGGKRRPRLPVLRAIDAVHGAAGKGQKYGMDAFGPFLPDPNAETYGAGMGRGRFFAGIF